MQNLVETKQKLKAAIAEELREGLDAIELQISASSRKYNEFVQQRSRFNDNKRTFDLGNLSVADYRLENARIRDALVELIDRLKLEDLKTVSPEPPTPATKAVKIFLMYDESAANYVEELKKFFVILKRNGDITLFDMHKDIGTGVKDEVIANNLADTKLVMCLINPMFMFTTLPLAEQAHQQGKALVPVLLEETPLEDTVLERFFALPTKFKYVSAWPTNGSTLSAAYMDIYTKIKQYLDNLGA